MNTFFGAPKGTTFFTQVSARDAGEAAAVVLANPEKHVNATYTIVSAGETFDETAASLTRGLGRTITYTAGGYEGTRAALIQAGFQEWQADGINQLTALPESGELQYTKVTNDFTAITGK